MQLLLSLQNYCGQENFAGNTHLKVVPLNWVQSYPEYATDGHNFNTGIVLKPGKQWLIMPCVSDSIDFRERERDTKHGPTVVPVISGFIANDTPNIAAVMNSMRGYEWIAILQYKTGESKVIGHPDAPARFTSSFINGRRLSDNKGYDIEFYSASDAKSFFIESPEIQPQGCAPATWRLVDSDNNELSTGTINSGEEDDIPAPDTTLEINGVNEGEALAGSTIEIQLTDGVDPVTPVSVNRVGNTWTAELPAAPTGWVRNPDWLPLPEITAADNRFVGLFLVFENEYNQTTMQITSGAANIDWGDGASDVSNGAVQTKVYDYATIVSPVKQYYDGRNYKQVIIDVTTTGVGSVSLFFIDRNNGINNGGCNNYGDISCSFSSASALSAQRYLLICERLWFYKNGGGSPTQPLVNLRRCRSFNFDFTNINGFQLGGRFFGNIDVFPDINAPNISLDNSFRDSSIREFGIINATGNATLNSTWLNSYDLEKLPNVQCDSVTNMNNACNGCSKLVEANFYNCGNVSLTASIFNGCRSLSKLTLQGIIVGFSIANCNLTETALNDLFTSLGTASGSQTIIVTGNPGAATCDTSIATGKGFTVTT
jgi:hypothetical protein